MAKFARRRPKSFYGGGINKAETLLLPTHSRDLESMVRAVLKSNSVPHTSAHILVPKDDNFRIPQIPQIASQLLAENNLVVEIYRRPTFGNNIDGITDRKNIQLGAKISTKFPNLERVVISDHHHLRSTLIFAIKNSGKSGRKQPEIIYVPEGLGALRDDNGVEPYSFLDWKTAVRRYLGWVVDTSVRPNGSKSSPARFRKIWWVIKRVVLLLALRPARPHPTRLKKVSTIISALPASTLTTVESDSRETITIAPPSQRPDSLRTCLFLHQPFVLDHAAWAEMITAIKNLGIQKIVLKAHRSRAGWSELLVATNTVFASEDMEVICEGLAEELISSTHFHLVAGITSTTLLNCVSSLPPGSILSFVETAKAHCEPGSKDWGDISQGELALRVHSRGHIKFM